MERSVIDGILPLVALPSNNGISCESLGMRKATGLFQSRVTSMAHVHMYYVTRNPSFISRTLGQSRGMRTEYRLLSRFGCFDLVKGTIATDARRITD